MADKLHLLLGTSAKKFAPALAATQVADISAPLFAMAGYSATALAGVYQEMISVTGSGRLRAVLLKGEYGYTSTYSMTLRITIDGVAYSKTIAFPGGSVNPIWITLAEGMNGANQLSLLPSVPFSSSLKIEVLRSNTSLSASLYELHELEV